MRDLKTVRADIRTLRKEMRERGIKRTSCFNGGMDRETQRYNERVFALETEQQEAKKHARVPAA